MTKLMKSIITIGSYTKLVLDWSWAGAGLELNMKLSRSWAGAEQELSRSRAGAEQELSFYK